LEVISAMREHDEKHGHEEHEQLGHDHHPPASSRPEAPGHVREEVPGGHMHDRHGPPTSGHPERHASVHEGHHVDEFRRRFWLSLILTIPIVFYAELPQELLGYTAPAFPGSAYLPLVLGSIVFFYGGLVFLRGAYQELGARAPGMMTLISLAITVAYLYSLGTEFIIDDMPLYWELATLVTIMLLGHWLEMRAVSGARGALAELANCCPTRRNALSKAARRWWASRCCAWAIASSCGPGPRCRPTARWWRATRPSTRR
jgi:P-type Cu2+ transporter